MGTSPHSQGLIMDDYDDIKKQIQNVIEDKEGFGALKHAKSVIESEKPHDRSSLDRHYAIVLTDIDKIIAYYKVHINEFS